jgi:hypothetical protein
VSDGHFSLVLISSSFYGVTESGGRGLAIAPSAVVAVSMNVSTLPVVLAAYSMILVIFPSTIVLLALDLASSKLRDFDSTSTAAGGGGDGEDNMAKLPYLMLTLLPMVGAMSPPDRTLASLAVAGCTATVAGGFGYVVLFAVALAGVPCSKRLHFAVPLVQQG